MNAERELETSPASSPISSKLAGALVIGCLVAGIAISGRHRPSPHADETAVAEAIEPPTELSEQSDYFRRPERPRSPAFAKRTREDAFPDPSAALVIDPLAETAGTNLPRLESKYSSTGSAADQLQQKSIARAESIGEPASQVRLASGTAPTRPRLRVRTAEATVNAERAGESDSPPLRPSHPVANRSTGNDQTGRVMHHTIRDGDTLESIAELRLGNARRWRELYDLNRDLLSDPATLPVGAKLRLSREPRKIAATRQNNSNELEPIAPWEN